MTPQDMCVQRDSMNPELRFVAPLRDEVVVGVTTATEALTTLSAQLKSFDQHLRDVARLTKDAPLALSTQEMRARFLAEHFAEVGRALYAAPVCVIEALTRALADCVNVNDPDNYVALPEDVELVRKMLTGATPFARVGDDAEDWASDAPWLPQHTAEFNDDDGFERAAREEAASVTREERIPLKRAARRAAHELREAAKAAGTFTPRYPDLTTPLAEQYCE